MLLETVIDAGPTGLLVVVVLLVLFGYLPTRRAYADMRSERDRWQAIALESMEQTRELLVSARVTREVLSKLPSEES